MTNKTILVIDDSPTIQKIVRMTLSSLQGYEIVECLNEEALDKIKQQKIDIDLIVLDFSFNNISGFELISSLKEIFLNVPLIVMLGTYDNTTVEDLEGHNVDDFVKKPFDGKMFLEKCQNLIRKNNEISKEIEDVQKNSQQENEVLLADDLSDKLPNEISDSLLVDDESWKFDIPGIIGKKDGDDIEIMPPPLVAKKKERDFDFIPLEDLSSQHNWTEGRDDTAVFDGHNEPIEESDKTQQLQMDIENDLNDDNLWAVDDKEVSARSSVENSYIDDDKLTEIIEKVCSEKIEKIAWKIIPKIAEKLIKEEINHIKRNQ